MKTYRYKDSSGYFGRVRAANMTNAMIRVVKILMNECYNYPPDKLGSMDFIVEEIDKNEDEEYDAYK